MLVKSGGTCFSPCSHHLRNMRPKEGKGLNIDHIIRERDRNTKYSVRKAEIQVF